MKAMPTLRVVMWLFACRMASSKLGPSYMQKATALRAMAFLWAILGSNQ